MIADKELKRKLAGHDPFLSDIWKATRARRIGPYAVFDVYYNRSNFYLTLPYRPVIRVFFATHEIH